MSEEDLNFLRSGPVQNEVALLTPHISKSPNGVQTGPSLYELQNQLEQSDDF